jgi:hypothetical protein
MNFRKTDWQAEGIEYHHIQKEKVFNNNILFYSVAGSSFLESTVGFITQNLITFYQDDEEVRSWLRMIWDPEEMNHGRAMKYYVQSVWPDYDWEAAYASFYEEYSRFCQLELLRPTKALEMLARCVTETEAAMYYRAASAYCPEPILKDLLMKMYRDEVKHFKHFLQYFKRFNATERNGLWRLSKTMLNRNTIVAEEDIDITFRHIHVGWKRTPPFESLSAGTLGKAMTAISKEHFPYDAARRMLFKPLETESRWRNLIVKGLEFHVTRRIPGFA